MSLQYISDSTGETTGVFIPISEWNELKSKYKGIEEETNIPQWHIDVVRDRLNNYQKNPDDVLDFHQVIDDLEKNF